MTVLPMFPLGALLLPGEVLPLQVFEPRYMALVRDCVEAPSADFGVVMIERGSEVGGGDERSDVGTVARIAQIRDLGAHRLAVASVGIRRIRVTRWLDDDPYPRAEVEDWDDLPVADADFQHDHAVAACHEHVMRVLSLASDLGHPALDELRLAPDPVVASYQLVAAVPVGPADRNRLLCAAGPRERVAMLAEALDDLEAVLRFQLGSPGS